MEEKHPFAGVNLRNKSEKYQIDRGEYGVFHSELYNEVIELIKSQENPE
jgi:hypothetical protein